MENINQEYIIKEQDIVNTYDSYQQDQTRLYRQYKCIKQQNPEYGYKRIAKLLNQPYAKTRWWHSLNRVPVPAKTVEWLKEKKIIALQNDHPNLKLIAKVLGSLFGDGGIFEKLKKTGWSCSGALYSLEFCKEGVTEAEAKKELKRLKINPKDIHIEEYEEEEFEDEE